MSRLEIRLFGEFAIAHNGAPWRFKASARAAALLAYLVLNADRHLPRTTIASLLWPDEEPEEARAKLRRLLYQVEHALPPGTTQIAATATTAGWKRSPGVWIDVHEFERAAADSSRASEAVALYRGELFASCYDDWILAERERLQSELLRVCYDAAFAARRERDFDSAIAYVNRILGADEWREDAQRLLMALQYESGDRTGALASFERFSSNLRREMGVEPTADTLALRAAILQNAALPPIGSEPREEFEEPAGLQNAFVGRAAELEALSAAWQRAARGSGSTVFVAGPAGIGKSRLVSELALAVQSQGGRALFGRTSCPEAFPYEPVVDALRAGIALLAQPHVERALLPALCVLLPELRGIVADLPVFEGDDPELARKRLLEAVVRTIQHVARARPLLLVIEDAHWARSATLTALEAIASGIGSRHVLAVVTFRSDEVESAHPLRLLQKRLLAQRRASAVTLGPLDAADLEHFVRVSETEAPVSVVKRIYATSAGNPLFALHLLRSYAEGGALPEGSSAGATIAQTILTRIARLGDRVRTLAETAGAIGLSFSADLAARVLGWSESDAGEALDVLAERGIVREAGGGAYAFTHALIADAVYAAMPAEQRALRHRRIAQLLSRTGEDEPVEPASIARHWTLAGNPEGAAQWYLRAARAALAVHAREEAVGYAHASRDHAGDDLARFAAVELAVAALQRSSNAARLGAELASLDELAQRLGPPQRFTALRKRAQYANQISDLDALEKYVEELFALAPESGGATDLVDAYLARGELQLKRVEFERAPQTLAMAIELAVQAQDGDREIVARLQMIHALIRQGDVAAARTAIDAQRQAIERYGAPIEMRLRLLVSESIVAAVLEDGPALERIGDEMLAQAKDAGDLYCEARAHTVMAHSAYVREDYGAIRPNYDRAIELFEVIGDTRSVYATYTNRAEMEIRLGWLDDAIADLNRAAPIVDEQMPDSVNVLSNNRAKALLLMGRTDEALECAHRAYGAAETMLEPRLRDETLVVLGSVEAAAGNGDAAIAYLERALAGGPIAREDWYNASNALCYLVDTAIGLGKAAGVAEHAQTLAAIYEKHPRASTYPAQVCWTLSRFHAVLDRPQESEKWRVRGLKLADAALTKMGEDGGARNYAGLPFIRALLETRR